MTQTRRCQCVRWRDWFPFTKVDWLHTSCESKLQVKGKIREYLDPSMMCGTGEDHFALCLSIRGTAPSDGFEEE